MQPFLGVFCLDPPSWDVKSERRSGPKCVKNGIQLGGCFGAHQTRSYCTLQVAILGSACLSDQGWPLAGRLYELLHDCKLYQFNFVPKLTYFGPSRQDGGEMVTWHLFWPRDPRPGGVGMWQRTTGRIVGEVRWWWKMWKHAVFGKCKRKQKTRKIFVGFFPRFIL